MSAPLDRYLARLRQEVHYVDSRGVLQVNRIVKLELDALYEPLRLKIATQTKLVPDAGGEGDDEDSPYRAFHESDRKYRGSLSPAASRSEAEPNLSNPDQISTPPRKASEDIELSVEDALQRNRRIVVLGDPGSGKTTLLKKLCLDSLNRLKINLGGEIPV